jgi:hypothetical protein
MVPLVGGVTTLIDPSIPQGTTLLERCSAL